MSRIIVICQQLYIFTRASNSKNSKEETLFLLKVKEVQMEIFTYVCLFMDYFECPFEAFSCPSFFQLERLEYRILRIS